MEKKTIGKFISVLRKANGMTQRDLADKLFVSDKTVSRWECDECTPDLTLIPAIAEIFGITTDELLRGERNNASVGEDVTSVKQKTKSDKQFKAMLYSRELKYKNLTLVSVGLIALALIVSMIFNLGFLKGIIGFCVSAVFLIASVICQTCFASSARMPLDEDEDDHAEEVKKTNSNIIKRALKVFFGAIVMLMFILPIAFVGDAYRGLTIDSWLKIGLLLVFVTLILVYIVYILVIRKKLIRKELLYCDKNEEEKNKYEVKLLGKTLTVAFSIAVVLFAGILVLNSIGYEAFAQEVVFNDDDDWQSFKEFMKNGKGFSVSQSDFWHNVYTEPVSGIEDPEQSGYMKDYLYYKNGDEYISYECLPNFVSQIRYLEFNEDGSPAEIAVYTSEAMFNASRVYDAIGVSLLLLIAADFAVCALVYVVKIVKRR